MDKLVNDPFSFAALRAIELGQWDAYLMVLHRAIWDRREFLAKQRELLARNGK
jgi:hypothetical protein